MILLFFAGAATELLIFIYMRLTAEHKLRRMPLLLITACEYTLWAIVVRRLVLEEWPAIAMYALGGLTGVFVATLLPTGKGRE